MTTEPDDPADLPILTDAVDDAVAAAPAADAKAAQSAIVGETLKLADSLLHQAAKDIEATLFENVFDRLRAQLPELVDRILLDQAKPVADRPIDDD